MRLIFLLSALLLFYIQSNCQDIPDSLRKYSYILLSVDTAIHNSTAFLYKSKHNSYVISNYHSFTGINVFGTDTITTIKHHSFYLKCKKLNSNDSVLLPIKLKLDSLEHFNYLDKIDLLGVPFIELKDVEYNYINRVIEKKYLNKRPVDVISFGYPSIKQHSIDKLYQSPFFGYYEDDFKSYDSLIKKHPMLPENQLSNFIKKSKKNNFLIYGFHEKESMGRSGSPVFGRFIVNNKNVYRFIGVIYGGGTAIQREWCIKGKAANRYFKKELK